MATQFRRRKDDGRVFPFKEYGKGWGQDHYERPLPKGELTAQDRSVLPRGDFAIPEKRAYPIHDVEHAKSALARVSQRGSPEEKRRVRTAVHRRYGRTFTVSKTVEPVTYSRAKELHTERRSAHAQAVDNALRAGKQFPEGQEDYSKWASSQNRTDIEGIDRCWRFLGTRLSLCSLGT